MPDQQNWFDTGLQAIEEVIKNNEDWNECLWNDAEETLLENLKEDEDAC
tara:strand:- start:405 stop:551 length:147 start_codon:yes stop_codon:yes gene_type:complete